MTREEIISGLKFTVEMFLLNPSTGETYTEPRNDMDKITIDACRGAIEVLKQEPKIGHWIETAEEYYKAVNEKGGGVNEDTDYFTDDIACSECLAKFSVIDNEAERFDFCPKCGAKMVEPQESESDD